MDINNLERFVGKSAEEILAILKAEQEQQTKTQAMEQHYAGLGIARTKNGDKIMIKLPDSYPVTQTRKGWEVLAKLIPFAIQAFGDLGVDESKGEKAA